LEGLQGISTGLVNSVGCWSAFRNLCSLGISSKVRESVCFCSWPSLLSWSSLNWSSWASSLRNLGICQLFILCLTEPLPGVNWILNIVITINILKVIIITNITWETGCVCVFSLNTIRVNVSILAAGDTVSSTGLLPEGTISSNISKSETSIIILVRVTFKSSNWFFPLRAVWSPSWFLSSSSFLSLWSWSSSVGNTSPLPDSLWPDWCFLTELSCFTLSSNRRQTKRALCRNFLDLKHLWLRNWSWFFFLSSGNQSIQGSAATILVPEIGWAFSNSSRQFRFCQS